MKITMTCEEFEQVEDQYVADNKLRLEPKDIEADDVFALVSNGLYTAQSATLRLLEQRYPDIVITRMTFDNNLPLEEIVGICVRDAYIVLHSAEKLRLEAWCGIKKRA